MSCYSQGVNCFAMFNFFLHGFDSQCVMNPDNGEPTDDLEPTAIKDIAALGSKCTKVSEVVQTKDEAVFEAIQQALTKANEKAISNAQKV